MVFLNKKEDVIDLQLTQHGKYLLSQGKLNPVYYAFFDDDVIYDQRYVSGSIMETQNEIEGRIMDDTPTTSTQYLFHGIEDVGIQNQLRNLLYSDQTDRIQKTAERHFALSDPLGDSELISNYAPSFNIKMEHGKIANSETTISGSSDELYSVKNIPQINSEDVVFYSFVGYPEKETSDSRPEIIFEFEDGTYINVEQNHILMTIVEENTNLGKDNFDIEVYELDQNNNIKNPLYFKKPREYMRDGILLDDEEVQFEGTRYHEEEASPGDVPPLNLFDLDEVGYYFDISIDSEIED